MPIPFVKVCGLTRPEDIRSALDAGVRYFGLNRYAWSPRFVDDDRVSGLLALIPGGRRVFVDVATDPVKLAEAIAAGFDFFQIHFDPTGVPEAAVAGWSAQVGSGRLWLAPRLKGGAMFPTHFLKYSGSFLLDGYSADAFGGTGKTADWAGVAGLKAAHPDKTWIVAGGLGPDNVVAAARASRADILDLNSGVEDAPGLKSGEKLRSAISRLDVDFNG